MIRRDFIAFFSMARLSGLRRKSMAFAASHFWRRRGQSDEHIRHGSVRSEHEACAKKGLPPGGLRCFWPMSFRGSSVTAPRGCSLLAPRHRPKATQRTSSYLRLRPLSWNDSVEKYLTQRTRWSQRIYSKKVKRKSHRMVQAVFFEFASLRVNSRLNPVFVPFVAFCSIHQRQSA